MNRRLLPRWNWIPGDGWADAEYLINQHGGIAGSIVKSSRPCGVADAEWHATVNGREGAAGEKLDFFTRDAAKEWLEIVAYRMFLGTNY